MHIKLNGSLTESTYGWRPYIQRYHANIPFETKLQNEHFKLKVDKLTALKGQA